MDAVLFGFGEAGLDSLGDDVAFELGHGADDGEHCFAQGSRGVDVFPIGDKVDAEGFKFLEGVDEVLRASGKPVEPPNEDRVELALAGFVHEEVELGAGGNGAGDSVIDVFLVEGEAALLGVVAQI